MCAHEVAHRRGMCVCTLVAFGLEQAHAWSTCWALGGFKERRGLARRRSAQDLAPNDRKADSVGARIGICARAGVRVHGS